MNKITCLLAIGLVYLGQLKSDTPALKFERPIIVDTLCKTEIDLAKYKVYFRFRNVGKKPIIITRVRSGDPDFACYFPREPIKANQQDSIGICLVQQQMMSNINSHYWVEYSIIGDSTQVRSLQLQLKRVVIDCKD